jgi:NAD(P)-dependent dehydrogenase (short-subunit alcohol dehydrogenase family)
MRAAAHLFAEEGASIAVDLPSEALDEVTSRRRHAAASLPSGFDAAPRIDVAYLNAGVYGFTGPIDQLPLDVYRRTIGANIDGVVLGTRAVVPGPPRPSPASPSTSRPPRAPAGAGPCASRASRSTGPSRPGSTWLAPDPPVERGQPGPVTVA